MKRKILIVLLSLLPACSQQMVVTTVQPSVKTSEIKQSVNPIIDVKPSASVLNSTPIPSGTDIITSASPTLLPSVNPTAISNPSDIVPVSPSPSNSSIGSKSPTIDLGLGGNSFSTVGMIDLTFKDEFKIRYNKANNKFISLTGADVSSINNTLISNSQTKGIYESKLTEAQAQEIESSGNERCKCDYKNPLSRQLFQVQGVVVNDFITKLANNSLVREIKSFSSGTYTNDDYVITTVDLKFWDEYQIKYSNENKLYSLAGEDTTSINNLLSEYEASYFNGNLAFFIRGKNINDLVKRLNAEPLISDVIINSYSGPSSGCGCYIEPEKYLPPYIDKVTIIDKDNPKFVTYTILGGNFYMYPSSTFINSVFYVDGTTPSYQDTATTEREQSERAYLNGSPANIALGTLSLDGSVINVRLDKSSFSPGFDFSKIRVRTEIRNPGTIKAGPVLDTPPIVPVGELKNLTLNSSIESNSVQYPTTVIDGDPKTITKISLSPTSFLTIDLKSKKIVNKLRILATGTSTPKIIDILGSDDNINFKPIVSDVLLKSFDTSSDDYFKNDNWLELNVNNRAYRYIKFNTKNSIPNQELSFMEVEAYGYDN